MTLCKGKEAEFDCVIVDEAHRVYDYKPSQFGPKPGTNMLDFIIRNSKVNVFFVDEDQAVTIFDYTTVDRIKKIAKKYNSPIIEGGELSLSSQFRCTGGIEYIDFVKGLLGYEGKQTKPFSSKSYEFKVFDSAEEMRKQIAEMNSKYGNSRIVAGYTHDWVSLKAFRKGVQFERTPYDFSYDDGFKMRWNKGMGMVDMDYSYLADEQSINEIGCIHTIQGLDLQYCGVIIGKDITYENGKITFHKEKNVDNVSAKISTADDEIAEKLIRNTYNVLLTRGMRGTFVYCEDEALREYLKKRISFRYN